MSSDIKVGDEVKHKSDTQKMTVDDIRDDVAVCTWVHKGKKQTSEFLLVTLEKHVDEGPWEELS